MKKSIIYSLIAISFLVIVYFIYTAIQENNNKPQIYHLQDTYSWSYYVYPNFKNNHLFIKHLFEFANKHSGTIEILTNQNDIHFEDGAGFINESSKNHHFFFARQDSNSVNNKFVVVDYSRDKEVEFQISTKTFGDSIQGKELKANFNDINVNIVQNFLDYADKKDGEFCRSSYECIYELYNRSDRLIIRQKYTNYGKYFTIEMY